MKAIILNLKKEFAIPDNLTAAVCCLVLSIAIFFIMSVLGRETLL